MTPLQALILFGAGVVVYLLVGEFTYWRRARAVRRSDAALVAHIGRQMAAHGCRRYEVER